MSGLKFLSFNIGKDDDGKDALKSKLKEIRLGFYSHGTTGWSPEIKAVDEVLVVPGVKTVEQMGYADGVQKFIEKML